MTRRPSPAQGSLLDQPAPKRRTYRCPRCGKVETPPLPLVCPPTCRAHIGEKPVLMKEEVRCDTSA